MKMIAPKLITLREPLKSIPKKVLLTFPQEY